jgi:hypothetical protein
MMLVVCKLLAANFLRNQLMLQAQRTRSNRNFGITESVFFDFFRQQPPSKSRKLVRLIDSLTLSTLCLMYRCGSLICIVFVICSARMFREALTKNNVYFCHIFQRPFDYHQLQHSHVPLGLIDNI